MEFDLLKSLVDSNKSIRQIGEHTCKSYTAIRYWLNVYGLKTDAVTHPTKNKKVPLCKNCGESNPDNFYHARNRCKTCHNLDQMKYVRELKLKSIKYKGGHCEKCGYNKNYSALDFHHVKHKDPNWKTARHWSWERLKTELDRCKLLCKNCHAEEHHPECVYGV